MNVLLLSPDGPDREAVSALLANAGHEVVSQPASASPPQAIRERFDVIVLDLAAGQDALKLLRRRASARDGIPVVCIADRRRLDASAGALRLGAADIIGRPIAAEALEAALSNSRELAGLMASTGAAAVPEQSESGLFGASPLMREVLSLARRVAPSRCAVLIIGERGTGREMVARTIHASSPYAARSFVKITCPGVSDVEMAAVLGRAEPHSTIYLENLSELPIELQVCLEQQLVAVPVEPGFDGGAWPCHHKALRIVAGAQPRMWDWMERGLLRRELVDALSVVRIDLPPLRQRQEDIPLLATRFLKEACSENGVPPKAFSRPALTLLAAMPWPGNATELRALCERLVVLVPRGVVLLEDVLANVRFDGVEALGRRRETLKVARERFERDYITETLQQHRGRMGAAAQELGIERTNLYRKIRALNVRWADAED